MPRLSLRLALPLLCASALLSACAPAAAVSVAATATPAAPTPTATLAPAPTPTNVPDGWLVLDTTHFSIAYPSDWTAKTIPQMDGSMYYLITPPTSDPQYPSVSVSVTTADPYAKSRYCTSSADIQRTTLAGLPMTFMISGEGSLDRSWGFSNTQQTSFGLAASDAQDGSDVQAQDDAILATFRPDNADPWTC